jgi:RNA recognition motif-containing protein
LPKTTETAQVRKIFAIAPKIYAGTHKIEPPAALVTAKPVRITEVPKLEGQDDSVAFLEFTQYEHALVALQQVNNNPAYFQGRRLIVEFALENNFMMKGRRKNRRRTRCGQSASRPTSHRRGSRMMNRLNNEDNFETPLRLGSKNQNNEGRSYQNVLFIRSWEDRVL